MLAAVAAATPLWAAEVSNVKARQRWPWNGLVDVDYEVGGYTEGLTARISFAEQGGAGRHWVATNFLNGATPSAEPGPHRATWDAAADGATNVAAAVVATVELVQGNQLISPTPVTPEPTESALKLYSFLRENYGRKVISGVMTERPFENDGQYTPQGYETQTELKYVHDASGKNVVVVGFDFLHTTGKNTNEEWYQGYTAASLALAKTVWNAGGIPAFCWHWKDPMQDVEAFYTEESGNTPYTEFGIGKAYDETTGQWKTESAEYQAIVRDLETVADALLQLQDAGVAVLWRPLHDASSRKFWWGTNGPKSCVALYRLMFDVFVNQKGLRNLVWVWTTEEKEDALAWYPGDDCVDVVGRDFYYYPRRSDHASLIEVFTAVRDLFGGRKIVALSENGSVPYPAEMEADGAHWSWFMPWYGDYAMEGWANDNTVDSWNTVMNDDYCLTLEDMPGWDNYTERTAAVATSGISRAYFLDTRDEPRNSLGDETLAFSSLWDGGADATVTIAQDGVAIAENLAGEGERAWSVPYNGTYELTHVTYTNGVAGKVETAKFVVTGKAEPPEVTDVVATPSEPWDGRVSISFNVVNSPAAACPDWNRPYLSIVATDNVTGSNYVSVASALTGDTDAADGAHMVTWDMDGEGIKFYSTNVTFTVAYLKMPDWCVIDLSGGKDAAHYPVTYVSSVSGVPDVPDVPGGTFNTDAYKTTNLVMRLVGPEADGEQPFYCAVFETTQRQWELVTGERPSWFANETCYATRPVEKVSWNMIRGDAATYDWPNVQGVASDSFVGVLRQKTGLAALDLPTEAQWEYACRAGTTTDFNNGKNWSGNNPCPNMDEVGRYWYNGGSDYSHFCATNAGTAAVGSYDPNKWGLYDMHGNVREWCLERYSSSGSNRVLRGGSWNNGVFYCASSSRGGSYPSFEYDYYGFRLVRTLSSNFESERSAEAAAGAERAGTVCSGTSEPIRIGGKDFAAGDIALADYSGTYDGEGHTIGIATNAIDGLVLRYAVAGRDALVASGFPAAAASAALPLFTNVCDIAVYVEASAPGYVTFTTNATVKITQASLTITAKDQTYRYNGMAQGEGDTVYEDPDVIAGKVEVEGLKGADMLASIILDGQGTDAGTYPIEPSQASVANGGSTVTGNYDINYVNGTLTILGEAAVSDVQAASGEPWDGKVQIAFNVTNSPAACLPDWNQPYLSIVATDNVTGSNYVSMASALSGDTDAADGAHMVTWDMDGEGIKFYSTNVTFTVAYLKMPDWCVIDLSGGERGTGNGESGFAVSYFDAPPEGGWTSLHKTTNLVMRLIGPGTFEMGESGSTETTEITNAFYCAVFETTQRQWELVTGGRPSYFANETCYATRPVERVSWNAIRGDAATYDWPDELGVDTNSFVGVLRRKSGLASLDLPAEAQWEFACRAGTTAAYNNGSDNQSAMDSLGRHWNNGGSDYSQDCATDAGTAAVGSYQPNAWGLYDMHGNVFEWCLERYSSSGSNRVGRGGSWFSNADYCRSSNRFSIDPSIENADVGFRLVRTLSDDPEAERGAEAAAGAERAGTVCAGTSEPITVGKKPAAELVAELKWKHLKATGTYFAQLKLTCTNWLDSGISDLRFMFADRVGADGKTSAALWSTPLRSANTNVEESAGTTYRFVALDESLFEEENTPVVYGVADLSATAIPVAERTIEMYVRTGVAPEGQNADSAQVDDFVGYVCWTSSDEACAVPVVASGVKAGPKFGAVRPLAGASLPSPKMLNESLALGVPVVEGSSPYCRVTEFSVGGERIKGRIEVGAGENVGSLGANATVSVLGAASPAGPFEELGAVEVAEDGSFSLAVAEGAQFFKLRIDVKEVVR